MLQVTGNKGRKNIQNVLFCPSIPSYLKHNLNFQRLPSGYGESVGAAGSLLQMNYIVGNRI